MGRTTSYVASAAPRYYYQGYSTTIVDHGPATYLYTTLLAWRTSRTPETSDGALLRLMAEPGPRTRVLDRILGSSPRVEPQQLLSTLGAPWCTPRCTQKYWIANIYVRFVGRRNEFLLLPSPSLSQN